MAPAFTLNPSVPPASGPLHTPFFHLKLSHLPLDAAASGQPLVLLSLSLPHWCPVSSLCSVRVSCFLYCPSVAWSLSCPAPCLSLRLASELRPCLWYHCAQAPVTLCVLHKQQVRELSQLEKVRAALSLQNCSVHGQEPRWPHTCPGMFAGQFGGGGTGVGRLSSAPWGTLPQAGLGQRPQKSPSSTPQSGCGSGGNGFGRGFGRGFGHGLGRGL